MIRHIVIWTLHRAEDAPRFKALLEGCRDIVPGIHGFEVGIRTDGLEANADVVLVSSFADEAALAAYQGHPQHQAALQELGAMRASRHVVDYRVD